MNSLNVKNYSIEEIRNQFAVSASEIGVWDWNLTTNEVFYSKESLRLLEMNEDELFLIDTPEKWDEKVHPEDREEYFNNIKQHFDNKTPFYETYHRILCNGKYKWILDRGKVIERDDNSNPIRIIGTHTDVSSQKEKEQKILETLEVVNNQNVKLNNFAHIVSHNLRNHVGNLSSILKLNEDGLFDNDEFLNCLKTVSSDLTGSISGLLDLVKAQNVDENHKQVLNVNAFLNRVFNILKSDIDKKKPVLNNLIPDDFNVMFNSAYLESVLLNLTSNAIKYSKSNIQSIITYSVKKDEQYDILVIEDNGIGLDMEKYKDDLFGLYKKFNENSNSNGVGLHITKNQIESMGGKIEMDCEVNKGCTFKVYFKK